MVTLRSATKTLLVTLTLLAAGASYAFGPKTVELHHTVEAARISVTVNDSGMSGTVTAKLLDCDGCEPITYIYNANTVFINPLGAQKPIEELKTWNGNRAMFHFRKADKHIEHIQILP